MKNLFPISIFAASILVLNSCVSISNTIDDDVYVVKSSQIPVGESLDDETNYSAYKYKKDRNNNNIRYSGGGGFNNFNPMFTMGMGFRPNQFGYNPYMYNPYQAYANPYYGGMNWAYYPGYGWSYVNPYFGDPFYGGYGNYYGYNYYNHGYYSNYYGNNYYGNNNGWNNNNNNGGSSNSNPNHYSGPRGSNGGGGVITRSNIPGTIKSGIVPNSKPVSLGSVAKPVGKEPIMNRSNPSNQTQVLTRTNENVDYSRPGRIQNSTLNNAGSSSRGGSTGTPARNTNIFNGIENNSGNSNPSRNSGSGSGSNTTPTRNSGGGSVGTPSRNTGSGSSGGSGGSGGATSRPSSGSSGGGRR